MYIDHEALLTRTLINRYVVANTRTIALYCVLVDQR